MQSFAVGSSFCVIVIVKDDANIIRLKPESISNHNRQILYVNLEVNIVGNYKSCLGERRVKVSI